MTIRLTQKMPDRCYIEIQDYHLQAMKLGDLFCAVGVYYYKGSLCGTDLVKARTFYELSYKYHDPRGTICLADMYLRGLGGIKDSEYAVSVLKEAYSCYSETEWGPKILRYLAASNESFIDIFINPYSKELCPKDYHAESPCVALEILNEYGASLLPEMYSKVYSENNCERYYDKDSVNEKNIDIKYYEENKIAVGDIYFDDDECSEGCQDLYILH